MSISHAGAILPGGIANSPYSQVKIVGTHSQKYGYLPRLSVECIKQEVGWANKDGWKGMKITYFVEVQ